MTSPTPEPSQSTEAAPWPLHDMVVLLANVAEHCLDEHDYDGHGYEAVRPAIAAVRAAARPEPPVEGAPEDAWDGASRIAAERLRQVTVEGWTPEHDQDHDYDQLAWAAISYATPEGSRVMESRYIDTLSAEGDHVQVAHDWPWPPEWWKPVPDDRARELVKAGALIAAEIDRLTGESPLTAARSGHDGLREAHRVNAIAAQTIREGVNRLQDPWKLQRDHIRETLAFIDRTAADIAARALSPDPGPVEPGGAA